MASVQATRTPDSRLLPRGTSTSARRKGPARLASALCGVALAGALAGMPIAAEQTPRQISAGLTEVRVLGRPADAPPPPAEGPLFEAIGPGESGLDIVIPVDTSHPDKRLYYSSMACGSVAAGDLDGDGWPDLVFAAGPVPNRLYRNRGEAADEGGPRFEDATASAGIADPEGWATGVVLADVNGNGKLDIYICRYDAPNRLYLNESSPGEFRFREAAAEFGLDIVDASLMAQFVDYDGDGRLDLFLVTNAFYHPGGRPPEGVPMRRTDTGWEVVEPWDRYFRFSALDPDSGQPVFTEAARPNRLFRNEGGRFREVSSEAGILPVGSHSNGAIWFDRDGNGLLDLYVANDFADRDEFYLNLGDGTFAEIAADVFQHTAWFAMGGAAEDFNGNGRTDLIVADMLPTTHYRQKVTMGEMGASFQEMYEAGLPRQNMVNTFFVNTGTGFFLEAARIAKIAQSDWTWTVKSADFDGDGRVDIYFTTGHSRDFNHSDLPQLTPQNRIGRDDWDHFEDVPELRERDLVFRNASDWRFERMGEDWGLGMEETMTYGVALADFDRDGALDLVTVGLEDPPLLHRNLSAERGNAAHLLVRLRGQGENTYGVGARVRLETDDGRRQTRTLFPFNGYQESDEPLLHFGLGQARSIRRLEVAWPGGARQAFEDLPVDRWIEIEEPAPGETPPLDSEPRLEETPERPPLFRGVPGFAALAPLETPFDDFARQPLLPHQHSQLGPGQAWGDVDGDGVPDLYLGGPKGQPGRLLLSRGIDEAGAPVFTLRQQPPFTEMGDYEDLGALFLDANGNGHLDLLVVSGSVECEPGDPSLRDRLYLNDGEGNFAESPGALPESGEGGNASGSVAAAADFRRDGTLAVFVGGRVVPGQYPVAARNRLLVNDGSGRYADLAPDYGLEETGLVTAAIWSDIDGDGWPDLLLAHEWGPVRVFSNRDGTLVETTEEAGLAGATGFWNSIAGRDLTGNGAIDFVVGNLGFNTKYSASPEVPELIYYGDLDGSGMMNIVEAKPDPERDCLLPRRGLSCSTLAMPNLLQRVNTYHDWASSILEEIYEPFRLESALRLEATTLASVVLLNDGEGRFTIQPLPPMAQLAPVFGIALADFDGDGRPDIVLAQNFFPTQEETGPYNGGLSLMLRGVSGNEGNEGGSLALALEEVWPLESGIVVPGDAKSLGLADFAGDGWPDLFFGLNNAPPAVFVNEGGPGRPLVVRLRGRPGNPAAAGGRVTVEIPGLAPQTAEVAAGSGYLTQQAGDLFFGWGEGAGDGRTALVTVRWPDGTSTRHEIASAEGPQYEIAMPEGE